MSKPEAKQNPPFFRAVAGYHNKLVGEKDLILSDLQGMAEHYTDSSLVISKIKELNDIEAQLSTIQKHFGDNAVGNEGKTTESD